MSDPDRPSQKEYQKNYRKVNAQKRKEYNAQWYIENREKHYQYNVDWRAKNPERMREIRRKWRNGNPDRQLLHNARMRAKSLGIPFNLTIEDVVIPEICPVLGIKLCWDLGRGKTQHNVPSLDRINNSNGYVKGNVMVISWRANALKKDGTLEEIEAIDAYMRTHSEAKDMPVM